MWWWRGRGEGFREQFFERAGFGVEYGAGLRVAWERLVTLVVEERVKRWEEEVKYARWAAEPA